MTLPGLLPLGEARPLRTYQAEAIERLRQSLASGKRRPVLQLPTGGGKTRVASEIIALAQEKNRRVTFCVPALTLIDQTLESFWREGIRDIGVIQANHAETDWSRPVQIASVQTVARRGFPKCELVIVDECHRIFETQIRWMNDPEFAAVPFIGLSATPWTRGLGKHYDDLIVMATTDDMIAEGFLSPFRVFAPSHPDLSGVRTVAGDYHEGDLSDVMDRAPLVADVVETWIRRGEGRPTLCFGVDCAHAKHLQRRFLEAGVACGYMDAYTDPVERKAIQRKFHDGELHVVCNVGVLTIGVDWDVRCLILARPTKSEMLFTQIIGRALRTAPGKLDALILDHSDTHARLGFVTDIKHDELDDGTPSGKAKKRKPRAPKECPQCAYLRPAKMAVCPSCGFKPEIVSDIEHEDGDLDEITRGKKGTERAGHIQMHGEWIAHAAFFGQLKRYAEERGYKPGWASNQYRDAIGTWPDAHKSVASRPVSPEVGSWIKSRLIRWAKRKAVETPQPATEGQP